MRKSYDFSNARRNPYASRLKKQITIRIDISTIDYFTALAQETGIPYQTLMNLHLRACAATRKKLVLSWESGKAGDVGKNATTKKNPQRGIPPKKPGIQKTAARREKSAA